MYKVQKMIKAIFKTFVLSIMIIAQVHFAYAQSTTQGGIIPNGKVTFLDSNGKPLTAGQVYFYLPNTTTPKTTYQDINQTVPNNNPVTLDSAGRALIWGTGNYRQLVKDKHGNTIWDVTTSAAGSGSGGGGSTATGDGDLVGTIKPWAGAVAPNQYMFTYGQELSRTTYSALFTAITSIQSVFCTSGSPTLSGVGDTTNFWVGMTVEVSCLLGGSSIVISKTSSSVTLASNANVSTSTTATFFMWGNGNGTTTFNLPDFRGLFPIGNNNMGGVASSNINDTYFGSKSANSSGGQGGNQTVTLASGNIPQISLSVSGNVTGNFGVNLPTSANAWSNATYQAGATSNAAVVNAGIGNVSSLTSSGTMTGTAGNVSPTAFGIIPPAKSVNYIIKVTPDANSATANGVTSLGSMTGDIACGSGLTCSGNIISAISNNLAVGSTSISGGTTNGFLFNNGPLLGNTNSVNNGVAVTNGSGAPSISTTLPTGLTIPAPTISSLSSGTCSNGVAVNGTGQTISVPCPGAASSVQVGSTNVTSTTSNSILGSGSVTTGTGTLSAVTASSTSGLIITPSSISQSFDSAVTEASGLTNTFTNNTMMGWGVGNCRITPKYSTRVFVEITGEISESTGANTTIAARWGTGTAPANGAAVTGTGIGSSVSVNASGTTGASAPYKIGGIITGLTVGTAIWFDANVGGTNSAVTNNTCRAHEVL